MHCKTSGDFIIAEQLVRDRNNRKTSNALLFALVAQHRFIILAPSARSGNGSRKGTKELCCFPIVFLYLISDEDKIYFQIKGKGNVIIQLVFVFLSFHSSEILNKFHCAQINTRMFYLQGSSVSDHLQ